MPTFVRLIDTKRCIGCRTCVAACMVENHYTPGSPWNVLVEKEMGYYPKVRKFFATMACMHCEAPACKMACDKVGAYAINRNEHGVVLVDYEKCIGCGYCAAACPYGVPQLNGEMHPLYPGHSTPYEAIVPSDRHPTHRKRPRVVEKCTSCWHKLEKAVSRGRTHLVGLEQDYTPACDVVCPVQARFFGDLDDPDSEVAKRIRTSGATQLKKEFGTRPLVYYVLEGGDSR